MNQVNGVGRQHCCRVNQLFTADARIVTSMRANTGRVSSGSSSAQPYFALPGKLAVAPSKNLERSIEDSKSARQASGSGSPAWTSFAGAGGAGRAIGFVVAAGDFADRGSRRAVELGVEPFGEVEGCFAGAGVSRFGDGPRAVCAAGAFGGDVCLTVGCLTGICPLGVGPLGAGLTAACEGFVVIAGGGWGPVGAFAVALIPSSFVRRSVNRVT